MGSGADGSTRSSSSVRTTPTARATMSSGGNALHANGNGNGAAKLSSSHTSFSSPFALDGNSSSSAVQAITTEGWLELFLTPGQKRSFSNWKEEVRDKSITHYATRHLSDRVAASIPENVAPNVVTASGFACLGQAWYIAFKYGDDYPTACTWFAVLNIFLFFVTNSVDVVHANRIRQRTALGDLFKYCCDCCSTVFLALLTTYCLGGTDLPTQWYAVQAAQLVLFTKHLSAFHRNAGLRYNVLSGPGEVITAVIALLSMRATFGLDWFVAIYDKTLHRIVGGLARHEIEIPDQHMDRLSDPAALGAECVSTFYYIMYACAVIKVLLLKDPHGWSRFGLSTSLLVRFLPAIFLHFGAAAFELRAADVVCDGLFMAVLTSDVTLAKMAGREIHPWVVLMSMAAVFSHTTIISLVVVYYIAVFGDLCSYLNMPLMTVCRNVYCDGVYDLCHIGHKTLFRKALTFGNRLFVGVVGDEDASSYKRPPIMTAAERCAEVDACKSVTKVIPDAPCFGLTQDFLDEHQIHVVAYGEEYMERYPDPDDDPYYGYVRKIGIAKPLPRTKGLSTSDLIRRIQRARPADDRNDGQ